MQGVWGFGHTLPHTDNRDLFCTAYVKFSFSITGTDGRKRQAVNPNFTFIQPTKRRIIQRTTWCARHRTTWWKPDRANSSHRYSKLCFLVWLQQVLATAIRRLGRTKFRLTAHFQLRFVCFLEYCLATSLPNLFLGFFLKITLPPFCFVLLVFVGMYTYCIHHALRSSLLSLLIAVTKPVVIGDFYSFQCSRHWTKSYTGIFRWEKQI